jgi:hypothetical protein
MIACPYTGYAVFTGKEAELETFRTSPVFFDSTQCRFCGMAHEWFAKDAWICTPDCADGPIRCECRRRLSEYAA